MEQQLTGDDLLEFQAITQFRLTDYLSSFNSFIKSDAANIVGYYAGKLSSLNQSSNSHLQDLIHSTTDLFSTISLNKERLQSYKWWILIDNLEQIDNLLLKFSTISKWLRSTITNASFNPNPEVSIPFNQGQTLESVQRDVIGSADWDNTWTDLAYKNDLREEDYTSEAGFLLKANFNYTLSNFKINSIIDNPVDDRVLGLDLNATIQFDTTEQDLAVLSPRDTFLQTVTTLINLRKGDNPEFPDQGVTASLIVGSNINSLSYPSLFRELTTLFRNDDTIKSFTLLSIRRETDAVFIDFNCQSRLGDLQQISLKV